MGAAHPEGALGTWAPLTVRMIPKDPLCWSFPSRFPALLTAGHCVSLHGGCFLYPAYIPWCRISLSLEAGSWTGAVQEGGESLGRLAPP